MMEEWYVIRTSLHDMWSVGSTLLEEGQQQNLHTRKPSILQNKENEFKSVLPINP